MQQEHLVGPRLSDADFFALVDSTRPGLEGIPEAAARGDFAAAAGLPSDVFAAAQERGQARDLWATVEELLAELEKA